MGAVQRYFCNEKTIRWPDFILFNHHLVTHGASECKGVYDSGTGSGGGYSNSCIHSGETDHSGGDTVWYNYATASAGTIKNTNATDYQSNTNTATESICPKGWTLATAKQIDINRSASIFNPVKGGDYYNGTLYNESTYGYWWGSEAYSGVERYYLYYSGSSLYTYYSGGSRHAGFYIRCVSEEKTVTDLTYMQDMTPQIAANTPEGTKATLTDRRDGKLYQVAKINGTIWMTQNLRFGYDATNPAQSTLTLTPDDSNIVLSSDRKNPHGTPNDDSDDVAETVDGYRELITYDLVSRGSNECYGVYNDSTKKGWGPAYENACIHSGTIRTSGDLPTNWYNYTLASAGTIIDKNTDSEHPATNDEKATESVCPKGWTLPNKTQIDSQRNIASFSPVLGGHYGYGTLYNEGTYGFWWGSEAYNGAVRYLLYYNGSSLYTSGNSRYNGYYVRCVQKLADS